MPVTPTFVYWLVEPLLPGPPPVISLPLLRNTRFPRYHHHNHHSTPAVMVGTVAPLIA